jgi:hypothetical protein
VSRYIAAPLPGDVLAVVGGGFPGYLVNVGQALANKPSLGTHVVVVTHQDQLGRWIGIQGAPGGVSLVDCTQYLRDSRVRSNGLQPKPDDHGQMTTFLLGCAKSLGIAYDWLGILEDVSQVVAPDLSADIDHLWRWPDPKSGLLPGHVVCSSLAAMLYDLPAVGWQHPDLGTERLCTPEMWWDWADQEQWRLYCKGLTTPHQGGYANQACTDMSTRPLSSLLKPSRTDYLCHPVPARSSPRRQANPNLDCPAHADKPCQP